MTLTRRLFLTLAAAAAINPREAIAASDPKSKIMAIPSGGVSIEWGYDIANGTFIHLKRNLHFRDPFNTNLEYFFPNQQPSEVVNGYRQSSTGAAEYTSSGDAGFKITYYHEASRDRDGSAQYTLEGSPLNGDASNLSLTCPPTKTSEANPPINGRLLTDKECIEIAKRINNGSAVLFNTPPVYTKAFGYELADGGYFIAYHEEANWPDGQECAFIGKQSSWQKLHNVIYIDPTSSQHGLKADEGFLQMPLGIRGETLWNGKPVRRILNQNEIEAIARDLRASPVGQEALKPVQLVTPCSGPGM